MLGFLPKPLELAPNQFLLHLGFSINLPLSRVPSIFSSLVRSRAVVLLGCASNVLYEPIPGTRPNLLRDRSPRRHGQTLERANISPRREGTRLSEIPRWLLVPPSSPRQGKGIPPE
ncbi:hypothetical protein DEO72_LG11g1301 [Vigna unguiculata]|uniref:Uncharacterized protein n=1 Tax=Vigna unguiculata TaxID=3917 RepID=A0A4D6NMS4_VIGUN|nr:hypothetical protein DEO72_LG11g1301 [Vigna unguiculata]